MSNDIRLRRWHYNTSGGSTGEPVRFVQDNFYTKYRAYTNKYYYETILNIKEERVKKIILWGSEKDLFKQNRDFKSRFENWLNNTVFLNAFKMSPEDMKNHIKIINSYKPFFIRGYAGSLFELSKYIEENNINIHKPKFIVSSAEVLQSEMRSKIEKIFSAKVYNYYGSREVNGIAGECKFNSMHIFSFWNYIEVLDNNNNSVKEDEEGRIIVTNLYNYSMPLIRYEIGDAAILGTKNCRCGSSLPVLQSITGRLTDHFITRDKKMIYGAYFRHLFFFKDWIKRYQIIQENYDTVRIKMVVNKNRAIELQEKQEIEDKIRFVMGNNCIVIWDVVEDISTTETGKYLYTQSLINR